MQRTAEQIVDIPVPGGLRHSRGGPQSFLPAQGSTASSSVDRSSVAEEVFEGFFRALIKWLVPESPRTRAQPPRGSTLRSSASSTRTCGGRAGGMWIGWGGPGGSMATMLGAFGGPRGVDVIMQRKFQQFFEFVIVPQIQFIVRVLNTSVVPQRQVRTVPNCAEYREDSTGAVLGAATSAGEGDSAENRGGAAVAVCSRCRRHPCCGAEANPSFAVQKTVDFQQVQFLTDVR